jgi:hypothetical protein
MDAVLLGVVGLLVGALVALYGVRVFYLVLPLWGFVAGVLLGADAVHAVLGDGFLATAASWGAGIVLGVVLAVTATLWLWAGVLVLAFSVGAELGSGLVIAIGIEPGLFTFAAGILVGVLLVVVAIAVDGPVLLVAALSALGGAALMIDGALAILGRLQPGDLEGGVVAALRGQPLMIVGWLLLAGLALVHQLTDAAGGNLGLRSRVGRSVA